MAVDERIAERRREVRESRRRRRLRRTLAVVALLAGVAVVALLDRSSLLALAEVRVVGAHRLTADEIRAASGLEEGTSSLRLRLGRVEDRVAALPLVREARARRVDPLTVEITVVERVPALVVTSPAGQRMVDADGVTVASGTEDGLPVVQLNGALPAPGETVATIPALANAHAAWRALPGPLRTEVTTYLAAGEDDLDLVLESGVRVRFGRADRADEKARALGEVLEDLGGTTVSSIDVRAPRNPVVRR